MGTFKAGLLTYRRTGIIAALAFASLVCLPSARAAETGSTGAVVFSNTVSAPLANLTYADTTYGTSSSSDIADASAERDSFAATLDSSQPPPRRRTYGRPRYADRMHNADGSTKLAFEVGAGMAVPSGPTGRYYTPSYKFSVGGGLNFNKTFGVLLQYDYDHFGLTGGTIANQYNAYNGLSGYDPGTFNGLDANAHIWSLSVNPTISFQGSGNAGAYIVGGVGYYRKTTNFTLPSQGSYCDYYGFCYTYTANQTFDSYTSGAFGVSGGFGLTYKISRFSSQRLFAEARYVWTDNDRSTNTFFLPNSYRTGYFPVTAGVRW
jgi:hypothetical protein